MRSYDGGEGSTHSVLIQYVKRIIITSLQGLDSVDGIGLLYMLVPFRTFADTEKHTGPHSDHGDADYE